MKIRQITALILVLLLCFAVGCGGSKTPDASSESKQPKAPADTGRTYIEGTRADVTGMPEVTLENDTVTIYCWSEYLPEYTEDWQAYRFTDYYGGKVEVIVSSGDYYENLYKLIAAGDIPDIVIGDAQSFPALIMKDLVQPWDEYVDFSDPIWEQTGSMQDIQKMTYDGKIYNITHKAHNLGVLFYNQRLISEAGLEEPMELQARGEWTWEKFREYLYETTADTNGDGITDVYGLVNTGDFLTAFFASTGDLYIEYENGTYTNNIKSTKIQDAANFIYGIGPNGDQLVDLGNATTEFLNGKAAFVYTNDYRGYIDYADLWQTDGIGIVPLPKYSGADEQYQASLTDHFWLMKGAKNPKGAALLVLAEQYDSVLNANPDAESPTEAAIAEWMGHGFTREAAEAVVAMQEMPTKILWTRNIPLPDGYVEFRAMDTPWITLADTVSGSVDQAIKDAMQPQ